MFFKNELLDILDELSLYDDFSFIGEKAYGNVVDYLSYIWKKLKEKGITKFVPAKDIIRQLQKFYDDKNVPLSIKSVIKKIFEQMEPRDQNYRWFDKCNCASCRFFRLSDKINNEEFIRLFYEALQEQKMLKNFGCYDKSNMEGL